MFKKALLLVATVSLFAAPTLAQNAPADPPPPPTTPIPMEIGGRTKFVQDGRFTGWQYQWPAVYFEAHFRGGLISLKFDDSANNFNVIIDGKPYMILRKPGNAAVDLVLNADGPGNSMEEHTIRLEKRSETQYTTGIFEGFFLPWDNKGLPATPAARQIEFIGDSLTVGYGNTSAFTKCTPDEIFETTDSQEGFGPLTAKHFNADYQVNAFSGLGMVRNYDGHEHPKYHMPMLYDRAIFDDPAPAVQPDWHPQIIVIGIGGNDFSTDIHPDEPWKTADDLNADYIKTYTAFIEKVRAGNPGAFILMTWTSDRNPNYAPNAQKVFDGLKADGLANLDRLVFPALERTGCNGHPNIHDDAALATAFEDYIDAHPDLWQGK